DGEDPALVRDEREGTQEDSLDPGKDRGAAADADGQAKHRQEREARAPAEHPETEAEVLDEPLEPQAAPRFPRLFRDECLAAEFAARVGRRLFRGFAERDPILLRLAKVRGDLLLQLAVAALAAPEGPGQLHGSLSEGAISTPPIASESCSHLDFSCARSLAPEVVRRSTRTRWLFSDISHSAATAGLRSRRGRSGSDAP